MKSWALAAVCISLVGVGGVAACSSSDTTDTGSGGSGGDGSGATGPTTTTGSKTTTTSTTAASMTTTTSTVSSTGPGMMSCTDEADFAACFDCFAADNMAGAQKLNDLLLANCYCDAMAPSKADCDASMVCTDPMAMLDMACSACQDTLTNMSPCIQATIMDCQADGPCSQMLMDIQGCPQ